MNFLGQSNVKNNILFMVFLAAFVISLSSVSSGVLATHDAIVTVTPDIANCGDLGDTFTANIENDDSVPDADDIFEVRIYKGTQGVSEFYCGPAPMGWTLSDYAGGDPNLPDYGYCEYKTSWNGEYVIEPGEDLDFTFDAVMEVSDECYSEFLISTLDNKRPVGEHEYNWPRVYIDCTDPEIEKEITVGTYQGVCPPDEQEEGNVCWMTHGTIHVTASDDSNECDQGIDYCEWELYVDDDYEDGGTEENGETISWDIVFDEDSEHVLTITCYDVAGNSVTDTEVFRVDDTPPETTKTYTGPHIEKDGKEWVDTVTTFSFSAEDGGNICHVGGVKTYYQNHYYGDDYTYCEDCNSFTPSGYDDCGWIEYESGEISVGEESCHVVEFYSEDALGNKENVTWQCYYSDHTPPTLTKDNGEEAIPDSGEPNFIVDDVDPNSPWYNPNGSFHWITTEMPITFTCIDEGPHPSGGEQVCFKVSYNYTDLGNDTYYHDYITQDYCTKYGGTMITEGDCGDECGYCCVPVDNNHQFEFKFDEECMHNLEYYCKDAVEKGSPNHGGDPEIQYYKVDDTPPIITKDMLGTEGEDYLGDCPHGSYLDHGDCYVADNGVGGVHINVTDPDTTGMGCASDDVTCDYKVWWNVSENECHSTYPQNLYQNDMCLVDSGSFNENGIDITFNEDSTHTLEIWCEDKLRNSMYHEEEFLVDSTPPETTKTYGTPTKVVDDYRWITSDTPITLEAEDEKVGVKGIYYKYEWVSNETCESHPDTSTTDEYQYPPSSGNYVFPSTNEDNKNGENTYRPGVIGPHVNLVSKGVGEVTLEFVNPENYVACFEYRTDGNTSEVIGTNYHPDVTDLYPYVCLTDEKVEKTISADMFVEVRSIFGGERDWDFDWTRFDVIPNTTDWTYVEDNSTVFSIPEDSCHVIKYFSVDKLGNIEEIQKQFVMVDNTPPNSVKEVGEPKVEGDGETFDWWVTNHTPITLDCEDSEPHPVEQETLCFKVSLDDEGLEYITDEYCEGELNDEGYCCVYVGDDEEENKFEFHFLEDSNHNLEYYCVDHLGNDERDLMDGEPHIQWYKVDTVPPTTTKTYIPDAYIDPETGYEYIDTVHNISLTAEDGGEICAVGVDKIFYRYLQVSDEYCAGHCEPITNDFLPPSWIEYTGPFKIPEESCHIIEYRSIDKLGNTEDIQWQCVFADHTPPVTTKTYGQPYFSNCTSEWITSDTPITLEANDPEPHPSGVNETWYRDVYLPDENDWHYCYSDCNAWTDDERATVWDIVNGLPTAPEPYNPSSRGFVLYEGPFKLENESCHIIEYYSYDNVKKVEQVKHQCVFVDNSAPKPNKIVGEPRDKWTPGQNGDPESNFYPEANMNCWNESSDNPLECWEVTQLTPISLDCTDPEPHPVDHEKVCFKVELDGKDATREYCRSHRPPFPSPLGIREDDYHYNKSGDGFCCVDHIIENFYFYEETEHELEYYCVDALGNKRPVDIEKFKVQGTMFEIPLYKKWNLISVPFVLLNDDPAVVFNNTEGVKSVWTYDPEHVICGQDWCVWTPGEAPDNLKIEPGWGYWVLETKDESEEEQWASEWLKIGGSLFSPATTPPSRHLQKGWNLIGYYGTSWELYDIGMLDQNYMCGDYWHIPERIVYGDKVYCALNSLVDTQQGYPKWSSLWSFINCGDHQTFWIGLNACADSEDHPVMSNFNRMYAGRGYWIELDEEDLYTPATTCIWNDNYECIWTGGGIIP